MKKKLLSLLLVAVLAVCALPLTGCSDEIENGSKIQRMVMTLDFYDASGNVVDTKDVQLKLFTTYAPKTTARFIALAEDGYYNGTCVSNVQSGWFEFGGYEYDASGAFVEKSFDEQKYGVLEGEFLKNGVKGNKLTSSSGALIMKHDYALSDDKASKYNSAKGTVILALSSVSKFPADEYCVFGKVVNDDADNNPSSDVADSSLTNRSGKTSLGIANTVSSLTSDNGTRTFYYEKEKVFYTRTVDDDGDYHYYNGTEATEANEIVDEDDIAELEGLISGSDADGKKVDNACYLLTVPYTKVVIKSIKKISK